MKNNTGFTYVEMLISVFIASILVLSIGAIGGAAKNSYKKVVSEAQVFGDITYGFKLMQNRIRRAKGFSVDSSTDPNWVGSRLMVDNSHIFGLYQETGSTIINLVYVDDKDNIGDREIVFSIPNSGTGNLSFSILGKSVTITFSGEKHNVPFNISTTVTRRI